MNISFFELLVFDYILLFLSIIVIFYSFWKGFIKSILGILTWVGSIFITIYTYEYLSEYLNNLLININFLTEFDQFKYILSIVVSIPLIFLISLFILKRVRGYLSSDIDKKILGLVFDKLFGAIYGLLFVYVIYSTSLYFTKTSNFKSLNNVNQFLIENSNILNRISIYNDEIFKIYMNSEE